MESTDLKRVKKLIKWLIFSDYGENEKEIAEMLGYKKSSFSQILNGKVPLSDRFIDNLVSIDKNINKVWIKTGEGKMLKDGVTPDIVYINDKVNSVLSEYHQLRNKYGLLYDDCNKLKQELSYLKDLNQLLQENKVLLEKENQRLQDQENNYIEELKNTISRLERENSAIKNMQENRKTG